MRFVELIDTGSSNNWDSHGDMADHAPLAKKIDQPIAGLLTDLKRRGMLDDTLVVWTTEFGRTPGTDGAKGRGHHPACFSSWLAGGGVKGGIAYGATDDIGATVAENKVHVHDFHATILHLLGPRPREADLPPRRPRLPPDRRARQRGEGHPRVSALAPPPPVGLGLWKVPNDAAADLVVKAIERRIPPPRLRLRLRQRARGG